MSALLIEAVKVQVWDIVVLDLQLQVRFCLLEQKYPQPGHFRWIGDPVAHSGRVGELEPHIFQDFNGLFVDFILLVF